MNNIKVFKNGDVLTDCFHIYQGSNHLICYFEILMPDGKYMFYEFLDHKLYKTDVYDLSLDTFSIVPKLEGKLKKLQNFLCV